MLNVGLGLLALGMKILTSKEFLIFVNRQVDRWWDEDIPNKEKKIAVIKESKVFFGQYSEQLVGMVITLVVGGIRLNIEKEENAR